MDANVVGISQKPTMGSVGGVINVVKKNKYARLSHPLSRL